MRAIQYSDVVSFHGEGPFWDGERQRLLVMDMLAGAIVELGDGAPSRRYGFGGIAAMIRRRERGGFVFAVEHGVRFLDDDLAPVGPGTAVFDDPAIRMNEGGCDPAGRLFVGSMAYEKVEGAATLYRIDPDGTVGTALDEVTISNGIQWRSDGLEAFYIDTPTSAVSAFVFDPATGALSDRRTLVAIPEEQGYPDGMAIDAEGGLWVAMHGGSAVRRFDQDGRQTEVVELPVSGITACTFGGPDLATLFITTSRESQGDAGAEPRAGAVFTAEPGVRGVIPHAYAG